MVPRLTGDAVQVERLHRPASTSLSAAATGIRRPGALPGVSEAIQVLGMRFFNQLASTVAQSCIAFIAARGDALTCKPSGSPCRR